MKKILIITYYWPPAGGPGVQRILKFVKYLPEFGWEPIILTVENGEYPAIDNSLTSEIPRELKIYKTNSFEPFNLYKGLTGQKGNIPTHILSKSKNESFLQKISKWIRANVFIPDARVGWIPSIVKEGLKICEIEKPDIIFSSSPPHSLQIGAMKLSKKVNKKWVADFRDPWTDGFWQKDLHRSKYAVNKDTRLELEILQNASAVITVSDTIASMFNEKARNRYFTIPNGYDENDFKNATQKKSDIFKIVYSGSLRQSQIPDNFFKAIQSLKKNNLIEKLEIHFIGTIHPDAINLVKELNLNDVVKLEKYMPHDELINHVVSAQMLLLAIPNTENNEGILTGKLFEYIGANKFILGFGPKTGDAAKIINNLDCGIMMSYNENPADLILDKYKLWLDDKESLIDTNHEEYTRKNLTKKLSQVFDSLL